MPACKDWERFSNGQGDAAAIDAVPVVDADLTPPPWWDVTWPKRRRLLLENQGEEPWPAGTTIGVRLNFSAVLDPASDVRVRHLEEEGGTGDVDLSLDRDVPGPEAIWFTLVDPIPAHTADATYFVYYGATPGLNAQPERVFDLYETFGTPTLPAGWTASGAVDLSSSELVLGADATVVSTRQFPIGTAVDLKIEVGAEVEGADLGFAGRTGTTSDRPAAVWTSLDDYARTTRDESSKTESAGGPVSVAPGSLHRLTVERLPTGVICFRDDNSACTTSTASVTGELQLRLHHGGPSTLKILQVRTRAALAPAPTIELLPEELVPN